MYFDFIDTRTPPPPPRISQPGGYVVNAEKGFFLPGKFKIFTQFFNVLKNSILDRNSKVEEK
jgi:hypothetical protein